MNIGIDIDGVLTDFSDFRLSRGEELIGQIVNEQAYKFKDMFGCFAYKELLFWMHNLDYLKLPPKKLAKVLLPVAIPPNIAIISPLFNGIGVLKYNSSVGLLAILTGFHSSLNIEPFVSPIL